MKARTFKKPAGRRLRTVKRGAAHDAIGTIEKGTDTYVLTYGQFSLIDALGAILDQTGPADVVVSSWTAADAHLEQASHMIESMAIRSYRMVVDRSFNTRQPGYYKRMKSLFGEGCIREIQTHAKFMVVTNDDWAVVVRTSMNLNENPRFENIEISEDRPFAEWMLAVVDDIFRTVPAGRHQCAMPDAGQEHMPYQLVTAPILEMDALNIPETTYAA